MPSGPISDKNGQNGQNIPVRGGGGVLPYLGYMGMGCAAGQGMVFWPHCPKQGMLL